MHQIFTEIKIDRFPEFGLRFCTMKTPSKTKVVALTAPLAALAVSNVHGAFDAFLKIEGPDVKGDSQVDGYEGEIEILSFSWGVSNPNTIGRISGAGGGSGKVTVSDFSVGKRIDKASPKLFRSAVVADHFLDPDDDGDSVPIRLMMTYTPEGSDASVEVLSMELNNAVISELHAEWRKSGGDDSPMETVSFTFGQVKVNYSEQEDGNYVGLDPDRAIAIENPALEDDED